MQVITMLTFQRSYSVGFAENEIWIHEGLKLMRDAGVLEKVQESKVHRDPRLSQWKRLYCCWVCRAFGVVIGLKTTGQSDILSLAVPTIEVDEFEDDFQHSWFLRML